MKKVKCLGLLVVLSLLLFGCSPAAQTSEKTLFAMDTVFSFRLYDGGDGEGLDACTDIILELEKMLSVTDPDSALSVLNATGEGTLPEDAATLLSQTLALSERTGGALDPTIYPLVKLWGFTTDTYQVPDETAISETLEKVGIDHVQQQGQLLTLLDGAQLDFGAVAKGYAAKCCAELLSAQGTAALLDLGGNIQTVGEKPDGSAWQIGITNPDDPSQSLAQLSLTGSNAVVTSGSYQRYFEQDGVRYHHILDPKTGYPAQSGLKSVTIVAQDGFLADGLSTALFVMGLADGSNFWRQSDDFEAVWIDLDNQVFVTEGLAEQISGCEYTVISR